MKDILIELKNLINSLDEDEIENCDLGLATVDDQGVMREIDEVRKITRTNGQFSVIVMRVNEETHDCLAIKGKDLKRLLKKYYESKND